MDMKILVESTEFWGALERDLASAREFAYVQALTFEGDAAGLGLAAALRASPAADRRVLIDEFTRYIQSDRFRYHPRNFLDSAYRAELRATDAMIGGLRAAGVPVRFTNPVGPLMVRFAARDHKKLMLMDGRIAYLGGINFSDHNFAWHDMMLRIEDPAATAFLREDFEATWSGRPRAAAAHFPGLHLYTYDGRSNHAGFTPILQMVREAKESILVESPYLSFPFCEEMRAARRRGAEVVVLTPERNNSWLVREYIRREAARSGFDLRLYPGMTHLKAMLIDGRRLVLGSSNFDWLSYYLHGDVVAVVEDPAAIEEFRRRVWEPDHARSRPAGPGGGAVLGWLAEKQLRAIARASAAVCGVDAPARAEAIRPPDRLPLVAGE